jgi:hypothetical protein
MAETTAGEEDGGHRRCGDRLADAAALAPRLRLVDQHRGVALLEAAPASEALPRLAGTHGSRCRPRARPRVRPRGLPIQG